MSIALLVVLAYLLGSIPTGYWVVKAIKGIDLTKVGSGSTGTTNVLRNAGKPAAAFVFFVDIAKGFLPVWLAINYFDMQWLPVIVAMVTIIGHSKSIFLNFKGGKSAATGLGTMLAMNLIAGFSCFGVFLAVLFTFKIVSLSSMLAVLSSAVLMWLVTKNIAFTTYCAIGAVYVVLRHKDNIKRLLNGTEPRIGKKLEDTADKAEQIDMPNS